MFLSSHLNKLAIYSQIAKTPHISTKEQSRVTCWNCSSAELLKHLSWQIPQTLAGTTDSAYKHALSPMCIPRPIASNNFKLALEPDS